MKGVPGTICRREMQVRNKVGSGKTGNQKIIEYGAGLTESIRYYFAFSQKCVGNINWNKTPLK
jgi:hypothetical protein